MLNKVVGMNQNTINKQSPTLVVGLMTGTSLDGIDVAICEVYSDSIGIPNVDLKAFEMINYPVGFSAFIKQLLEQPNWEDISYLHFALPRLYADAITETASKHNIPKENLKLIGMHGQTVWHRPNPIEKFGLSIASTLQLGDGSALAKILNIPVVSDFRSADVAVGGQGAPLVPRFDFDFFRSDSHNTICLNIGGMANITNLPARCTTSQVTAFDTGPGNILINLAMQMFYNLEFDRGGAIARRGRLNTELLAELMNIDFISQPPPKSTGRELFNSDLIDNVLVNYSIATDDIISTFTHFTAESIVHNIHKFCTEPEVLIASGGGAKNLYLLELLSAKLANTQVKLSDDYGISIDAKEAIAFAYLAWRTVNHLPSNIPSVTGADSEVILGSISY